MAGDATSLGAVGGNETREREVQYEDGSRMLFVFELEGIIWMDLSWLSSCYEPVVL